jgi:predicted dehydrogenase
MGHVTTDRRGFVKAAAGAAAVSALSRPARGQGAASGRAAPRIRFGVIGLNHGHVYSQVRAVQKGGGELVAFHAREDDLAAAFLKAFPQARRVAEEREILEDPRLALVVSASIPDERAPLGVRAMRHGKDFMVDKPGATSLGQLAEVRRVQRETGRIYSILYGERLENRAVGRALDLARAGAIGRVVQVVGFGPHRVNPASRPEWFWDRRRFGGILCDIASHQADTFLSFTGSTRAEVVASQIGNLNHPDRPGFEDFGDVMWRGDRGTGYARVDWFTADGLGTWGDGRITVLGTGGHLEVRSNVDIGGRGVGSHLFLVDGQGTRYVDCADQPLPYGERLVDDVLNRTQTAMSQEHCFLATELVLTAQAKAQVLKIEG